MRTVRYFSALTALTVLTLLCSYSTISFAQEKVDYEARGRAFVTAIFSGKADDASGMMTDQMKEALGGTAGVQVMNKQITEKFGAFKSITGVKVTPGPQDYQFSIVACEFEKSALNARVVVGQDGKVAGLQFLPPSR